MPLASTSIRRFEPQWEQVALGLFLPAFSWQAPFWTMVLAIFGTTISPYLFFWQASQEVEETQAVAEGEPLVKRPRQGPDAINRIRLDTIVGMAFSNLVALAIIVTSAARTNDRAIPDRSEAIQPDRESALEFVKRGHAWTTNGDYDRASARFCGVPTICSADSPR